MMPLTRTGRSFVLAIALLGLAADLTPVAVPGASQPAPSWALTAEERAYLDTRGPLRFVFNDGFPPFTFVDEHGEVRGINRDFQRLMGVRVDLDVQWVRTATFSDTLAAMGDGRGDITGNLGRTPEREATMAFTEAYAVSGQSVWTLEGHALPQDLAGVRLAAVEKTRSIAIAERTFPRAAIVPVPNVKPGLDALRAGEVDAFLGGDATVAYYVLRNGTFDVVTWGVPVETHSFSFAVPKGDTVLLGIVEKGLASITAQERSAIFVKWTGHDLSPVAPSKPGIPLETVLLGAAIIGGGAAVGGAALWIHTLRRKVAARTRELHDVNLGLEARVAASTADLVASNRDLEAFAYSVSHDLRAPLRAVQGFATLLLEEAGPRLDGQGRHYAQTVVDSAKEMGDLIEAILQYSRAGRAEVRRERVDMTKLVEEVVQELQPAMEGRRVDVRVGPLPACQADPALLKRVWTNLLDNAVKFTKPRDAAVIEVGAREEQGQVVYFVRDNGVGFDMKYAENLFGVFQRLHPAAEFPGTGVGLAIVQRIVQRHGGRIWAESVPDGGATFSFTLTAIAPSKEGTT